MHNQFKTIGIIGKYKDFRVAKEISKLIQFLELKNYKVVIDSKSAKLLNESITSYQLNKIGLACDLLIAIGGDGTFLTAMRAIVKNHIPLVGINLGRLGFLVDISPHQILDRLDSILKGKFSEEKRYLLQAIIIRNNKVIHEEIAVNEVVIHRWVTPSMIEIVTHIDGVYLNSQRSDGLIISTPTGSTAYSLSAGGPIIHPTLNALVLVPLNPHTLSNRPIVVADSAKIEISFLQAKQINALVSCDYLEIPKVLMSDKIVIKKLLEPIVILHPKDYDYFNILRQKLNWSSDYHYKVK